jgi:tetratricopeptide (TPR) repeat protein
MNTSRTGKWIVGCCGAAIVVAAAGIVWIGADSKGRRAQDGQSASGRVPAKFGPAEAGVPENPPPSGGAVGATLGPVPIPGTEGRLPGSIMESLVLQKGETYYGKGEGFFKDGDFTSASRYLRAEVERHPDRFHPAYLLGLSLWKEGKLDEAITSLTSATSLDADSVKVRVNLGRVRNDAGSFQEALEAADEAIALDPESSPAHNVRGRALLNLDRKDEGIEAFKTAVEKDAANAYAQNNLGYALIGQGRFAEAVPYLEEAVRLKPDIGYFQNNLGMAYERTAQTDKAKAAYRKAVEAGGSDHAGPNLARLGGTVDDENITEGAEESSN